VRYIVRVGARYLDASGHPTVTERRRAHAFSNLQANIAANAWTGASVEPKDTDTLGFPKWPART